MRFREPLLLPAGAFAFGIALTRLLAFDTALALLAAAAIAVLSWKFFRPGLLIAITLCGIAASSRPVPAAPGLSVPDNSSAIFSGCVTEPAISSHDRERFVVDFAPGARARVTLFARDQQQFPLLPYGTRVEFEGKVRRPRNYADPGSFDNVTFLARQKIYWTASADASKVTVLPGRCGNSVMAVIFTVRSAALDQIERLYRGDAYTTGMMQAILIGETAKLDRIWTEDYRSTGTFHALVISGSHVALLAAVLLFLMRIVGMPDTIALLVTLIAAWLYAGITGWQAPVLRSAGGMTLYVIARSVYRGQRMLNTLAAVAMLFLIVEPAQLFDASFQLSFLAVAVIGGFVVPIIAATSGPMAAGLADLGDTKKDIRLAPRTAQFRVELRLLAETLELTLRIPRNIGCLILQAAARLFIYVYEIIVASLLIQIGLALPMAVYFHRLSVTGLTANAVIIPILTLVVPIGFAAIIAHSQVLASVCSLLLAVSRVVAGFHARWEPDWRIPAPPLWLGVLVATLLTLAAVRTLTGRTRLAAAGAMLVTLIILIVHPFPVRAEKGSFELSVLDVGQGDSLLGVFPSGELMLVDAGGIPTFGRGQKAGIDIGEEVVSPYLWSRSIHHLDVVAMTHAHEDHMGGMSAVLRNFHPSELWIGAAPESPEWNRIRQTANELHIRIKAQKRGGPFPFGGTYIEVLAPGPEYEPGSSPRNNDSLALRITYGQTSFLLTGDMEKQIEHELAALGLLHHDDVLKVGHHGSRTSSTAELLDAETPVFGLISVGFENSYGHPHPLVLSSLGDRHAGVFRTDQSGLITIISDGRHIRVEKTIP